MGRVFHFVMLSILALLMLAGFITITSAYTTPTTPRLLLTNTMIDQGQSILFTANIVVGQGTAPYSYAYNVYANNALNGIQLIANMLYTGNNIPSNSWLWTPAQGLYLGNSIFQANVVVTDAHPTTVNSVLSNIGYNAAVTITLPSFTIGQAASIALGQVNTNSGNPNQGGAVSQNSLYYTYSSTFDSSGDLWVADTSNNRVLEFKPPFSTNEAASVAIGQTSFTSNGAGASSTGLSFPIGVAFDHSGNLWVTDWNNNRVLEFLSANLVTSGAAAVVIGQTSMTGVSSGASSTTLYNPYSSTFDLQETSG